MMVKSRTKPRLFPLLLLPLLAACATNGTLRTAQSPATPVTVGVIAFNDFHGALEPPRMAIAAPDKSGGTVQVPAGGAAWLASAVETLRKPYAHHLTVSAGDLISASQLASSLYLDEPTVGVADRLGLDFNAVGNHEFDRGRDELLRMQNGGCARHTARQPCQVERFTGAKFRFLAASTITENGKTLFPASAIRTFGSGRSAVKVGVIGLTLKGTPDLVSPGGIAGLTFADEADSINALVPALKAQGASAIVVLIHQGGTQEVSGDPNGCAGFTGDIRAILDRLDPRVDVVASGHTHKAYVCDYGQLNPAKPFLLTSAGNYGTLVTDITLEIDPAQRKVLTKRARNVIVQSGGFTGSRGRVEPTALYPAFAADPEVAGYVERYTGAAKAFAQRPAGRLAAPANGRALAQLIADAQLAASSPAGAQIALMNPFGVRGALVPGADGRLTFGDIYAVQPFNNTLITQSLSGAEVKAVLEQGLDDTGPFQPLAPSQGLAYSFDRSRPAGDRITILTLNGTPLDAAAQYRVTSNSFLAQGGDGFSKLAAQRQAVIGMSDLDALEAWLSSAGPRAVPVEERARDTGKPG